MAHPVLIACFDLELILVLFLQLSGSNFHGNFLYKCSFSAMPIFDDFVNDRAHALLAFKSTALDTFKALCVWFFSELFFFVFGHRL